MANVANHYSDLNSRKKLFWIFQFLFWLTHWFVTFIIYPAKWSQLPELIDLTLTMISGFILSILLKSVYEAYTIHRLPIFSLVLVSVLSSLFCGIIFLGAGILISYFVTDYLIIAGIRTYGEWIKYIWYQSYPFIIWNAIFFGYKIWEEWNLQKQKTAKEKALAQSAQLEMLRYQLNPHFLFNTLSSLRALIRIDSNKAEQMVTRISEFLRYSLSLENENEVPLSKEIEIIKNYLDIEKVRFGDKICIEYNIDELAEDYPIPIFLIHPLIENSVKHGMNSSPKPLMIKLSARVTEYELYVEIYNSGKWSETEHERYTGKGLENVKKETRIIISG